MNKKIQEEIINILFEEVGKIKVHIIDMNSTILEIEYEKIADRIIKEVKGLI